MRKNLTRKIWKIENSNLRKNSASRYLQDFLGNDKITSQDYCGARACLLGEAVLDRDQRRVVAHEIDIVLNQLVGRQPLVGDQLVLLLLLRVELGGGAVHREKHVLA